MTAATSASGSTVLRCWLVLAAVVVLAWAGSIHTPWAADVAPRLWLYDVVFYLRFVVGGWALAEGLRLVLRRIRSPVAWVPLVLAGACAVLAFAYARSAAVLAWKVQRSAPALEHLVNSAPYVPRTRAAHFIVDGVSIPCRKSERWIWIGRPHGAGTGTSAALVQGDAVPAAPRGDAFRFRRMGDGWWMAYQHAARHARADTLGADVGATCTQGREISTHRQGLAFVEAGWREYGSGGQP